MEYNLDYNVKVSTNPEQNLLHKWSIQEYEKKDNEKIGSEMFPYEGSIHFLVENIKHEYRLKLFEESKKSNTLNDENIVTSKLIETEFLVGDLVPDYSRTSTGSISMFGTNRYIKNIKVWICVLQDGENPSSSSQGIVSYSYNGDIDFDAGSEKDFLGFTLNIDRKYFDRLFREIQKRKDQQIGIQLTDIDGFYSEWSPSIHIDEIKVLTNIKDQGVVIPLGCEITPPRLGSVRSFQTYFKEIDFSEVDND